MGMPHTNWKRRSALFVQSLTTLLIFGGVCGAGASHDSLRGKFLAGYPRASRELERFYEGCRLEARRRRPTCGGRSEVIDSLDFSMNGNLCQATATPVSGVPESVVGKASRLLVSPSGGYELSKFPKTDTWVFVGRVAPSKIIFDPENSWAVLESNRAVGTDDQPFIHSSHMVVEYQDKKIDGFPVTAKVIFWKERGADRRKSGKSICDEIRLVPVETPASEFTLASHGIEGLSARP